MGKLCPRSWGCPVPYPGEFPGFPACSCQQSYVCNLRQWCSNFWPCEPDKWCGVSPQDRSCVKSTQSWSRGAILLFARLILSIQILLCTGMTLCLDLATPWPKPVCLDPAVCQPYIMHLDLATHWDDLACKAMLFALCDSPGIQGVHPFGSKGVEMNVATIPHQLLGELDDSFLGWI